MPSLRRLPCWVLAALSLQALNAAAQPTWMLLARHGECAPIQSLERKFPDLGTVADPDAFVAFVKRKGLEVHSRTLRGEPHPAVEVRVPERGLALVFVTPASCAAAGAH